MGAAYVSLHYSTIPCTLDTQQTCFIHGSLQLFLQAKFSEEDQALKERVDRLNEEIHVLYTPVQKLKEKQSQQTSSSRRRVCTVTPAWKSPHFSASISEFGSPRQTSTHRGSLPVVMVSSSSRDNLQDDLGDPVHETITEQEEGVGGGDGGAPERCTDNGHRDSKETRTVTFRLSRDTLSSQTISNHPYTVTSAKSRHK